MSHKHPQTVSESQVRTEESPHDEHPPNNTRSNIRLSRSSYTGTLLFNIGAFVLPALYGTLSKL